MTDQSSTIRWGIIGCGNVTERKSGPAFYQLPGSALVAVMRRNVDKARDYAIRHQVSKFYGDATQLINDSGVDAVYVATPPDTHARYAIETMAAGKPVYVEKPMALNHRQCMEMIEASEKYGVPLFVAYYRRALPFFIKVKELIDSEMIGRVLYGSLRLERPPSAVDFQPETVWRLNPKVSAGGYFVDLGAHQINLLQFLLGPVASHRSVVNNKGGLYEPEDFVSALISHQSGVDVTCTWCFCAPQEHYVEELELVGTEGTMRFSIFGMKEIVVKKNSQTVIFTVNAEPVIQKPLIARINKAIRDGVEMKQDLMEAATTTLLLQNILRG